MTLMEIYAALMLVFATAITFSVLWRFKKMKEQRAEMDAKFALRQAEAQARIDRENERERQRSMRRNSAADMILAKTRTRGQTQSVSGNSVGIQSQGSTTVVHDSSNDLLNAALMWSMMNNNSHQVSRSSDDTGYTPITRNEPREETSSSYSSSYSSSSSSSDDDSSSRSSSYSSSYSSSSSDSSYSSSSSDSSYSSSFSSD